MPPRNTTPTTEAPAVDVQSSGRPSGPPESVGVVAKAAFLLCASPWIVVAAARALHWTRRRSLDVAVEQLRSVPRFRWAYLRRPDWLCASVDRVLPLVPLRGFGPCLKRSLLLLDLWGRCGLEPRLHLGIRAPGQDSGYGVDRGLGSGPAEGHAWVSSTVDPAVSTSDQGYASGFSF
ncbi:MAG: lasso peptide biosynthesis protein [Thermoanaerobaculia bacterium]|nr:lasso peptide biosynthesis protein [Thermoanaerobaculia bacterium]